MAAWQESPEHLVVDLRKVSAADLTPLLEEETGVWRQALDWDLVDHIAAPSAFEELVRARAVARASESDRPDGEDGVQLKPLNPGRRTSRTRQLGTEGNFFCRSSLADENSSARTPTERNSRPRDSRTLTSSSTI